jgi:hypothetical protein
VPRAGFANHFADCLGDAAKDPELKAVFADVHAREADPRQKDAVVPPNPHHLLDHLSQLDRADRVVGVVQSAMQPYELKSTVSQYLRRQGIPGVVGYIGDNPLNPLRALGENRYLPAGADDKPCRPGVDGTADWRYGPAVGCMTMCIGSIPTASARSSAPAFATSTVTRSRRIHVASASNSSNRPGSWQRCP